MPNTRIYYKKEGVSDYYFQRLLVYLTDPRIELSLMKAIWPRVPEDEPRLMTSAFKNEAGTSYDDGPYFSPMTAIEKNYPTPVANLK